ncbi:lipopolysaccharide biosynthesis protein [Sinomonas sp. P10A9]|uniref:Lipopolysaccharide biosynthesis protein n=1 Tax=Sinomonas puerhi TaxID=3238584 RepID=A0AB39L901_9MICC
MVGATETHAGVNSRRSALFYVVGSLLQGLGILIIQPFAVRVLSAEQWGLVSTSVVTIQVIVVLLSSGLPLEITRMWFEAGHGEQRSLALHTILLLGTLVVGVVAAAVLLLFNGTAAATLPLVFAVTSIGLTGSILGAQAVLRAQGRPLPFVALSIGSSVVANCAGFLAVVWWGASASLYMMAYAVAVALTAMVALVLVHPVSIGSVQGIGSHAARIALPLLPHTGALMLLTQGAVWLLALAASVSDAGRYGAVLIFALGPITILNALNNAWMTDMMGALDGSRDLIQRSTARTAIAIALIVGVAASGVGLFGSFVLTTAPDQLGPIARTLPLLSVGYALFLVSSNQLYIDRRTRVLGIVSPATMLLALAASLGFALNGALESVAVVNTLAFILLGVSSTVVAFGRKSLVLVKSSLLLAALHGTIIFVLALVPSTLFASLVESACCIIGAGGAGVYWMRHGSKKYA